MKPFIFFTVFLSTTAVMSINYFLKPVKTNTLSTSEQLYNELDKNETLVKNRVILTRGGTIDNMPLVIDQDMYGMGSGEAPIEQRGEEFRQYLAPSLKIRVSNASGSGTICYYDPEKNEAWVISCGHLWSGSMSAEEGRRQNRTAKVVTWYHNDKKLDGPREYPASVIFYSNRDGYDISLLKFTPDWQPTYFPIAPVDFPLPQGMLLHSCGCDGGREVAHYEVEVIGIRGNDLTTRRNSPRPGRSGGGLMTTDGYYVGICWGTSSFDGTGTGYFTPLQSIHEHYTNQGYAWLLDVSRFNLFRTLPIVDRNNSQGEYPPDYIPQPKLN